MDFSTDRYDKHVGVACWCIHIWGHQTHLPAVSFSEVLMNLQQLLLLCNVPQEDEETFQLLYSDSKFMWCWQIALLCCHLQSSAALDGHHPLKQPLTLQPSEAKNHKPAPLSMRCALFAFFKRSALAYRGVAPPCSTSYMGKKSEKGGLRPPRWRNRRRLITIVLLLGPLKYYWKKYSKPSKVTVLKKVFCKRIGII